MTIFTIGHSNRTIEDFLHILQSYAIKTLVDVRRFPSSKKYPHFNQDFLHIQLKNSEIIYHFLGDELGGFRKGGYLEHVKTELFQKGIEKLTVLSKQEPTCLMCAEYNYFGCHRRFIADFLYNKNFTIIHIIEKKQKIIHSPPLL